VNRVNIFVNRPVSLLFERYHLVSNGEYMATNTISLKPKIYFIKDAEQVVGRNRLTLRRMWELNNFPKPTLINNRLAWQVEVIEQWINQNVQGV